jgi:hypothetical protein
MEISMSTIDTPPPAGDSPLRLTEYAACAG